MVLVILAILAAIMVPALTGWIDKAKEKQIMINARTAYLAAQTIASENYAKGTASGTITNTDISSFLGANELSKMTAATTASYQGGKVITMTYAEGSTAKEQVKLSGGKWDFLS